MRRGEMPDWAVDAAVESAQAARAERRRAETVREVCAEMCEHSGGDASEAYYDRYAWEVLIDRILAAHEREMAAVMSERDAEILRRATLEREMDAKDAEIARLKAELKTVVEVNLEGLAKFDDTHALVASSHTPLVGMSELLQSLKTTAKHGAT